MVVLGQKFFYSGKSGCVREKRLFLSKSGCGPKVPVTSLKVIWNEGTDQTLQGKRLSSRKYAANAT